MSRVYAKHDAQAGNTIIHLTPGVHRRWKLPSMRIKLVTDATVVNRRISVLPYSSAAGEVVGQVIYGAVQAASGTFYLAFGPNEVIAGATDDDSGEVVLHYPIDLDGTMELQIGVENGQVGDALSVDSVIQEEVSGE